MARWRLRRLRRRLLRWGGLTKVCGGFPSVRAGREVHTTTGRMKWEWVYALGETNSPHHRVRFSRGKYITGRHVDIVKRGYQKHRVI